VKESGRDELMWIVIHMCMEAVLGISLYSFLYLKLTKTLSFLLCLMFSFQQIGEKRAEQVLLAREWGLDVGGEGR
jgi:hypothetical protein